jgi:hypothetical protein
MEMVHCRCLKHRLAGTAADEIRTGVRHTRRQGCPAASPSKLPLPTRQVKVQVARVGIKR